MSKSKPTVLNMPEYQRCETVNAVYEALGILNEQAEGARECWSETWTVSKRTTKHTIMMLNHSRKFISVGISLIVGSSQQRRLKRFSRRNDVWIKSRQIADQTGADFDEVKELCFKMMNLYVDNDL